MKGVLSEGVCLRGFCPRTVAAIATENTIRALQLKNEK